MLTLCNTFGIVTTTFTLAITIKVCTEHTDCLPEPCLNQVHWLGISFKVFMTLWFRRAVNLTSVLPFLEAI